MSEEHHTQGQPHSQVMPIQGKFKYKLEEFMKIMTNTQQRTFSEEIEYIQELGGVQALMSGLHVDAKQGIHGDQQDLNDRIAQYGSNMPPQAEIKGFLAIFLGALDDFTLKILMVSAIVSIAVSVGTNWGTDHASTSWIEGFAIIIAIFICALVTSINDYQKERQFMELNNKANSRKTVNVIRKGESVIIHQSLVVTGDIVEITEGMEIPADGIILQASEITIDESSMTGETDPVKKNELQRCMEDRDQIISDGGKNTSGAHDVPSPILLSGTRVLTGCGKYLILVVGDNSCIGKIRASLNAAEPESTPLQQKLEKIARDIGFFGLYSALFILIILLIRFTIERTTDEVTSWDASIHWKQLVGFFIISVTVVVVAIPEGLPLSVTLSLAYSVKKMLNDQNLVRQMSACETMGGADIICSDKTGTLTQNRMTLTNIWNTKILDFDPYSDKIDLSAIVPQKIQELFLVSLNCNSAATLRPEQRGSKTEIAFLEFTDKTGFRYEEYRDKYEPQLTFPFSSSRKRMGVITTFEGKKVLLSKGASELVLGACTKFHGFDDNVVPLSKEIADEIERNIENLARQSLRTICLAYKYLDGSEDLNQKDDKGVYEIEKGGLTLLAIMGIKDILREEVKGAIQTCYNAGISVRMVTGDNKITAQAIALDCRIIDESLQAQIESGQVKVNDVVKNGIDFWNEIGGVVCKACQIPTCECPRDEKQSKITGKEIRIDTIKNKEVFDRIYPTLKVIARCRPDDKYAMVTGLKERGHIVAVTGDGTNDAPALKKADVGFAMGIAGTEVARDASAIILLDDNFNSIVKAVMWGRNIYDAIRKFLQFQLTVNVVAVLITLVGAALNKMEVLQAIQMLWINLIMDTFASLALATEPPTPALLDRKPHNRNDYIVSKKMFKHILGQALLQCIIIFCQVFDGEFFLPEYRDDYDNFIFDDYNGMFNNMNSICQKWQALQLTGTAQQIQEQYDAGVNQYNKIAKLYQMADGIYNFAITNKNLDQVIKFDSSYKIENIFQHNLISLIYNNQKNSTRRFQYDFLMKPEFQYNGQTLKLYYASIKYHFDAVNNTFENKYIRSGRNYKISDGSVDYFDIEIEYGPSRHFTYIFNTFVMLTFFNFFNARKIFDELNLFSGIFSSKYFLGIQLIILFLQAILVTHGGIAFHCYKYGGLTVIQWLICIGFGACGILMNLILKFIPEQKCLNFGNKEIDPTKGNQGIMSIKRSENSIQRQYTKSLDRENHHK